MSTVKFDKLLLPKKGVDLSKWSVIACDQYTSNKEYWEKLTEYVGDSPSTLNLICPEAYLGRADEIIKTISQHASAYENEVLCGVEGCMLVKRTTESGARFGIMALVDLEQYSYSPSNEALIRATEGTVKDRIPPRLKVRQACDIELPHILTLIDDRDNEVVEPLAMQGEKIYDVQLNSGGGRVEGFLIKDTAAVMESIASVQAKTSERVGQPLLMLVGDGNHSLATAKALYEQFVAAGDDRQHKARYALVEIENIWQEGIKFEPIHRLYEGENAQKLCQALMACDGQSVAKVITAGKEMQMKVASDPVDAYKQVQGVLDEFVSTYGGQVDYIHGDDELEGLCSSENAVGIFMPSIRKDGIFDYVAKNGVMPRKTFSMGDAWEKRYYMECRSLKHE